MTESLLPKDLRIETYRSGHSSAVRITHIPTGVVAESLGKLGAERHRQAALAVLEKKVIRPVQTIS